jgi:hypothetical protein
MLCANEIESLRKSRPDIGRRRRRLELNYQRQWRKPFILGAEQAGTNFWRKAIKQEMKNVLPAFKFVDNDVVPKFYKYFECHMIFDIKMALTRKARFVASGHQTDPLKESTYSSIVSRESIRIAFTLVALNNLDVLSADEQGGIPQCSYKG